MTTPFEPNAYSQRWFQFFHVGIEESRTNREVEFICESAPLPAFPRVLDLCCGMGRHARALCRRGYSVTGIERNFVVVSKAREMAGGPHYLEADVRDYQPNESAWDLAIVMSQSFGFFGATENRDLLRRLTAGLRRGGRVILDLWNPDFFATRQGEHEFSSPSGMIRETKRFQDGRLFVHLTYPDGYDDDFEWQLFSQSEMLTLAKSVGLALIVSCTDFDPGGAISPSKPRSQFVLERPNDFEK